jgi:hypothetical protein
MPMRVDGEMFEAAKSVGSVTSRSAAQQFAHWARVGRELESSPSVSPRDVQRVLRGEADYDDLGERGQAVVRAVWEERIAAQRAELDLAEEFTRTGRTWTEADAEGRPVPHEPEKAD